MDADHNNGQDPTNHSPFFKALYSNYDFRYKVVKTYEEVCKEVIEASKNAKTLDLIINGHGDRQAIYISGDENNANNWLHVYKDFKCLKDAESLKRIILLSCESGQSKNGDKNDNLASVIAKKTGKEVIAPTEKCSLNRLGSTSINPFDITYPAKADKNENIFKKFNPERVG